ncbi:unnamed protein product [Ostreobium quekettii]|uniref:Protein HIRA n=1 Tax=Ostreobium quekettii TaxID=121088 RepID=A0A8S1J855_9CHLO|nr:unnamed protein product [Ostreobium quekettii]
MAPLNDAMAKPCRVDRPAWVQHDEQAIFSIDIDPSSERFVTGGGDSKVKVWSLLHVLSGTKANELRSEVPRLLATLVGHTMPVSVVRFSSDGRYIASGADDACILLYELMPGRGQAAFGSSDAGNYENWRQTKILRFHATNVTDLAWSPADGEANLLASCSLDNHIAVWDVEESRPTATLDGHTSFVKGLAWDPMGLYLASQADDKSVIIWQTSDWTQTHRITSPFAQQPINNCFFTRLCWSPDGQFLTIVNSYQSGKNVGSVIRRGDWSEVYNLVGHHGAVTVARYCPKLFMRKGPSGVDEMAHCFVIGSHDRMYSMWFSGNERPVYVGKSFFRESVSDIAWAPGGWDFLVASVDGTIAVVSINEQTLGPHAPDDKISGYLSELYGDVNPGRRVKLVESAEQLKMEQSRTPLLKSGHPHGTQAEHTPGKVLGRTELARSKAGEASPRPAILVSRSGPAQPLEQKESRRADGRRKIQPVPIGVEQTSSAACVPQNGGDDEVQIRSAGLKASTPSDDLKRAQEGPPSVPPSKRLKVAAAATPAVGSTPVTLKTAQAGQLGAGLEKLNVAPDVAPPKRAVFPLKTDDQAIWDVLEDADITVEVLNGAQFSTGKDYARLVCRHGIETAWVAEVKGSIALVAGSPRFCAVATAEGDLQIFSASGIRLVPSILLGAKPSFLDSDGDWRLLSLTCQGHLRVWDVGKVECLVETSLFGLLSGDNQVVAAYLSNCGMPLCILSNYHSYVYKTSMKSWMRIVDDCFPFSHYHTTFKWNAHMDGANGELFSLQTGWAQHHNQSSRLPAADCRSPDLDSRSHLEHNMAAALVLRSPKEYKRWLLLYIRHLVKTVGSPEMKGDEESKLREICEGLLGPVGEAGSGIAPQWKGRQWNPKVLGMDKRTILKEEVLRLLGTKRDLQRLHNEIDCLMEI